MIILIAESKTMLEGVSDIPEELLHHYTPAGLEVASGVMRKLQEMTAPEIADIIKVSAPMAARIKKMAYDFPLLSSGHPAIESFTGVVFRALGYSSLPADARRYVDNYVRIISSLYGWLKPLDIINPYRLEFSSPVAPGDIGLAQYWRKDVTINLVRTLRDNNFTEVLDLMPSDAAKCVDKKLVKRFAKIWKVDFKQIMPGGDYRTPHAGKLKTLRGELLREMAVKNIADPKGLLTLETPTMIPLGCTDYPDHIAFCVE